MTLEKILPSICAEAANPSIPLYTHPRKAVDAFFEDRKLDYVLFEEPLGNLKVKHFLGSDAQGHLLVGFRAKTDASFRVEAASGGQSINYEVKMAVGEFKFAWLNEATIPLRNRHGRLEFTLTDVSGDVNVIGAFLDSKYIV